MHMWNGGFFGMGWIWMILFWLIIIAVVIVVVVLVVVNSSKQKQVSSPVKSSTHEKAVEKLKERYAEGEISREEYKQMMEDLKE